MTKQFTIASRGAGIKCLVNIQLTQFKGQAPYFSITGEVYTYGKRGRPAFVSCGCCHDSIQRITHKFDDIIALHLSDMDGTPMYAVENSLYWLEHKGWQAMQSYLRATYEEALELIKLSKDKQVYTDYIDKHLRPRWKQEAQAVIDKYNLTVEQKL